eukprot:COSAG06_NODE_36738_length_443_cov_1.008721_1_plen_90_part_01
MPADRGDGVHSLARAWDLWLRSPWLWLAPSCVSCSIAASQFDHETFRPSFADCAAFFSHACLILYTHWLITSELSDLSLYGSRGVSAVST